MTNPGTCAQCGRGYDPDYQLCDECQEAEDDALQNHCAQCGRSAPPDDRLCDECQAFADEADERIENEQDERQIITKSLPYASATSGANAREEITKILRRFGCESVGFMDDFDKHEVLLAFTHRGRQIQLPASAKGWAQMYLKAEP